MSSQLQIPCLGRPFNLGMLYDCHTEKLIPGITLWNAEELTSALLTTKQPACDVETTTGDTFKSRSSSLDIGADMKMSLMSGMVNVKGAAKFLHDRKLSEKQSRVTLQYKSTTHFDQLTMKQLDKIQHPHAADLWNATHVVTGITYGADAFLVFDRPVSEGEAVDKISHNMKMAVEKIPSYFGGASGGDSQDFSKINKTETDKFNCKFYGDFVPKSNPTNFDEALKLCKELPQFLTEACKPKVAYLMPLSTLLSNYQRAAHSIPLNLTAQVEEIVEHFHYTEMRVNDYQKLPICNKFVNIKRELTKFLKLTNRFKSNFVERLSLLLPKIRSDEAAAEGRALDDLIASVNESPFSSSRTNLYLESKEREIKQLTQYLTILGRNAKVQFDFPDTSCELLALTNDDDIEHVVCFSFSLISDTSPHVNSLDNYINKSGKIQLSDENEWFDKPEVKAQVKSEIRKFLDYVEATSTTERMAYAVTSSSMKTKRPSTLVHTGAASMPLNLPGTPRASKTTIDSITLQWSAPKEVNVLSYKVLYRSEEKAKFQVVQSFGLLTERYVKDLSHGIEYEFKIQATTTHGFPVQSDSAHIKTTEYYDIVLIGKTGQGKSTLGNKLLNLKSADESQICLFDPRANCDSKKRFVQADDLEVTEAGEQILSVTDRCKILSNEILKVRVLDVPGFSDSGTLQATRKDITVYEGNLQIIRWLVREQIQSQLKVRRIVYFLPVRGPLEKADGTLQEELKVLHHFFGLNVFDCVVVAATNSPKEKYQQLKFDENDFKQAQKAFHYALKKATDNDTISCPPIIYIGLHDSSEETLAKVQGASILKESILPLKFSDEVCALCSYKIRYSDENNEKICVINAEGQIIPYKESKCHPCFLQKYTTAQKVLGGAGHMLVLGAALAIEYLTGVNTWPGFTNSDEECALCKNSPGSQGCSPIGTVFDTEDQRKLTVDHSNNP